MFLKPAKLGNLFKKGDIMVNMERLYYYYTEGKGVKCAKCKTVTVSLTTCPNCDRPVSGWTCPIHQTDYHKCTPDCWISYMLLDLSENPSDILSNEKKEELKSQLKKLGLLEDDNIFCGIPLTEQSKGKEDCSIKYFVDKEVAKFTSIAWSAGMPPLLIGPKGTGKTTWVSYLAERCGYDFRSIHCHGEMIPSEWYGTAVPNDGSRKPQNGEELPQGSFRVIESELVEAAKLITEQERIIFFLIDELNVAPERTSLHLNQMIQSCVDGVGEIRDQWSGVNYHVGDKLRIFAAQNPHRDPNYGGTNKVNQALLSRFYPIKVSYLPPNLEAQLITYKTSYTNSANITFMIRFANLIRAIKESGGDEMTNITFDLCPRSLFKWAHGLKHGLDMITAFTPNFLTMPSYEMSIVKDMLVDCNSHGNSAFDRYEATYQVKESKQ